MKDSIILWQQATTTLGDSTLSQNGLTIEQHNNDSYQKLFNSIFYDNQEDITLYKHEQLQIYKCHNRYLIFSNCEEKDDNGRRIAFAARIETKCKSHVITLLQKELSLTQKTISQRNKTIIQVTLYRYEITTLICVLLLIIICFTLIYLFQ